MMPQVDPGTLAEVIRIDDKILLTAHRLRSLGELFASAEVLTLPYARLSTDYLKLRLGYHGLRIPASVQGQNLA